MMRQLTISLCLYSVAHGYVMPSLKPLNSQAEQQPAIWPTRSPESQSHLPQAPSRQRRRGFETDGMETGFITTPPLIWQSEIAPESDGSERFSPSFWTPKLKEIGVKGYEVSSTDISLLLGLIGVSKSCKAVDEGEADSLTTFECVMGVYVLPASIVAVINQHGEQVMQMTKELAWMAVDAGINFLAPVVTHALSQAGPFRGTGSSPVKRAVELVRRTEDTLSMHVGLPIHHIGMWDEGLADAGGITANKTITPVFGVHHRGRDMHFTLSEDQETGNIKLRSGHGPGPETPANTHRLRARSGRRPTFNKQYFDQGGIDAVSKSNTYKDVPEGQQVDPVTSGAYDFIYDSLFCELAAMGSLEKHAGFWWQIYDKTSSGTIAAGAVAPFDAVTPSVIDFMKPEGALRSSLTCYHDHDDLRSLI